MLYTVTLINYQQTLFGEPETKEFPYQSESTDMEYVTKMVDKARIESGLHYPWMIQEIKPVRKRGGARPNSGPKKDPKKVHPKTVAKRVPFEYSEKIDQLIKLDSLIKDWKFRYSDADGSSTSPRWEKMRQFFKEYEALELND
jgi:hypothetical protein